MINSRVDAIPPNVNAFGNEAPQTLQNLLRRYIAGQEPAVRQLPAWYRQQAIAQLRTELSETNSGPQGASA